MRYTIEAKGKKQEGIIEDFIQKEKLKLIDKYDPFEKLGSDVVKIGNAMRKFKSSGIDWSIFNYYLRGKGIPQQTIDATLGEIEKFFVKVGLIEEEKNY